MKQMARWIGVAIVFGLCMVVQGRAAFAGEAYGYYIPDVDWETGLMRFENLTVVPWDAHEAALTSCTISKTTSAGITKIKFTYRHPATGRNETVSWSGKFYYEFEDFDYNGHHYNVGFDWVPLGLMVCVDNQYYFINECKLKNAETPIPLEWQKARTLLGLYGEGCGEDAEGTVQIKCGKANKKGIAKVSMTITPFDGKKRSYRSTSVDVSRGGEVRIEWPAQKYFVRISGNEFFGEPIYGNIRPICTPDAVWSADVGGQFNKTATFDFGAIPVEYQIGENVFWLVDVMYDQDWNEHFVYASESVYMNGKKWSCNKASSVKWKKCRCIRVNGQKMCPECYGEWKVDMSRGKSNLSGLKLTYNAKSGTFKGSFKVYAEYDKGLTYSVSVLGVVVDGVGEGIALMKKPFFTNWHVRVE